jgi:hypothetical protein
VVEHLASLHVGDDTIIVTYGQGDWAAISLNGLGLALPVDLQELL